MKQRKQAAILLILLAFPLAFLLFKEERSFAALLRDPLAIIDGRSPGDRDPGALYNTKIKRVVPPTERVLSQVRKRILPPEEPSIALPPADPPIFGDEPLLVEGPILTDPLIDLPPNRRVVVTTPINPIYPGIPEPSTWMMMMVGMLATGWALRRKTRADRVSQPEAPLASQG